MPQTTTPSTPGWHVQDAHTGHTQPKVYPTLSRANSAAERRNQAYGAVRYVAIYTQGVTNAHA